MATKEVDGHVNPVRSRAIHRTENQDAITSGHSGGSGGGSVLLRSP